MTRRLVLEPEAEDDIVSARRWYEERAAGLGTDFLLTLEACFARIQEHPESFPIVDECTRLAHLRRFPFAVYYDIEDGQIIVQAVWHHRRAPR